MFRAKRTRGGRPARYLLVAVAALAGAGCGSKTYDVQGKLLWSDGTPVTELKGGTVVFESTEQHVSASGEIQGDGTFRLSTARPNDGAPPGQYRVLVQQPLEEGKDRPPPRIMHERFENFKTSGLTATVEPKKNEVTLTVERVPGRKGKR